MDYVIDIKNLNYTYKDFQLKNINLQIPTGVILGVVGENGAGKSTLIKSMLGIIPANYETMNILGKEFSLEETNIKQDMAVIFDKTYYNPMFTPLIIGKIVSKIYKNWDMNMYFKYLERFQIPKKKKVKELSKGMVMKLEFAIALSHSPKLLILDEATNGFDPLFREEFLELLREFVEDERCSVIICSHITSDLDKIVDYVAYMKEGTLAFVKTYDEMRSNYGIVRCKKQVLESLWEEDVVSYIKEAYGYKVLVKNKIELSHVFSDLEMENVTIEDIMLFYEKGERL